MTYFHIRMYTIIGAESFHCPVRDGKEWAGRVAGPEQRVSVEDALRAVTLEAAYSWRKENDLGSIAPGKLANFSVLEQDPLAIDPLLLKDVPIWGTVFEGKKYPVAAAR